MKAMTDKSSQDSSFSFSRRYFHWKKKVEGEDDDQEQEEILTFSSSSSHHDLDIVPTSLREPWKKLPVVAVSKLKSAFTGFGKSKSSLNRRLGTKVVGTLFGYRRGHVHFAFQEDPKLNPAFLVELATPTSVLVREMASGVVRIALECEKKAEKKKKGLKLLEEPLWRTYCNGKKYGYATRRRCAEEDWAVLDAVGPVTMGAGVLPGDGGGEGVEAEGEVMYMRARFERAVGSKDSEAFYMMNPDGHGGPELSIYLLRV